MAQIIVRGPVFTGAAPLLMEKTRLDVELAVTKETQRRVRLLGQTSFRYEHPTYNVPGKWRSQVRTVARNDYHVVTDSAIIYGHWLEGTGSRNRTTRFKGYFMWRRTYQTMNRTGAMDIARPIVERAVRFING